jgi:hypothetical protein
MDPAQWTPHRRPCRIQEQFLRGLEPLPNQQRKGIFL